MNFCNNSKTACWSVNGACTSSRTLQNEGSAALPSSSACTCETMTSEDREGDCTTRVQCVKTAAVSPAGTVSVSPLSATSPSPAVSAPGGTSGALGAVRLPHATIARSTICKSARLRASSLGQDVSSLRVRVRSRGAGRQSALLVQAEQDARRSTENRGERLHWPRSRRAR